MSSPRATRVRDHGTAQAPSRTDRPRNPVLSGADARPVGWSLYGAPWLQLVAITSKSDGRGSAENKPKPLPSVATGCREKYMVRRGRRFESVRGLFLGSRTARKWARFSVVEFDTEEHLPGKQGGAVGGNRLP